MGGFSVDGAVFFINEEKVSNSGGVQFWGLYAPCLYWGQMEAIHFFRRQGGRGRAGEGAGEGGEPEVTGRAEFPTGASNQISLMKC